MPYTTSKGVSFELECRDVLYDHSAKDKNRNQLEGCEWVKAHRYCSKTLFMTSVWPSDSGWYAVLMRRRVPLRRNNSRQKELRKIGSRSETMLVGKAVVLADEIKEEGRHLEG